MIIIITATTAEMVNTVASAAALLLPSLLSSFSCTFLVETTGTAMQHKIINAMTTRSCIDSKFKDVFYSVFYIRMYSNHTNTVYVNNAILNSYPNHHQKI